MIFPSTQSVSLYTSANVWPGETPSPTRVRSTIPSFQKKARVESNIGTSTC